VDHPHLRGHDERGREECVIEEPEPEGGRHGEEGGEAAADELGDRPREGEDGEEGVATPGELDGGQRATMDQLEEQTPPRPA
jgi:hypothetical protein